MSDSRKGGFRLADAIWLLLLLGVVGGVYIYVAGLWGFWEPWETEYAQMGRRLSTVEEFDLTATLTEAGLEPTEGESIVWQRRLSSWLLPENGSGDLVNKPWLTTIILRLGYGIGGGTEIGLRLPFALLALLALLAVFGTVRSFLGPHRAGVAALVTSTAPLFLMSAISLAGPMIAIAVTTMALCAYVMALCRPGTRLWLLVGGLLTGVALWAGGVHAVVLILGTVGCLGLWEMSKNPKELLRPGPIAAILVVATLVLAPGVSSWLTRGFGASKDLIGVTFPVGLALVAITAGAFSAPFRRHGVAGLALALFGVACVALPPMLEFTRAVPHAIFSDYVAAFQTIVASGDVTPLQALTSGREELLQFLLYNEFLSGNTLGNHVSFDTFIRQIGFSAYPYTIFFPFALAYLAQTVSIEDEDTIALCSSDRDHRDLPALKVVLLSWFALGVGLVGVGATLSHHVSFVAIAPMTIAVGLLLTDSGYWKALQKNKTIHALIGVGCFAILFVLTKDMKMAQDLEFGQRGPQVLFEFLLVDGAESFPETYTLPFMSEFRLAWACLIGFYFWFLLAWLGERPDSLADWVRRPFGGDPAEQGVVRRMALNALRYPLLVLLLFLVVPVLRLVTLVLSPARLAFGSIRVFTALMLSSSVLFAGITAFAYLPSLSDHLSHRGLIDTYKELAGEDEVIYWVGGSRTNANYYLGQDTVTIASGGENPIDEIRSVGGLRPHFCNPEERIWALLDRDSLAQAYYEVRRNESRSNDDECDSDRSLWVLDGRSSRYVLVSNYLNLERADGLTESNQNPLLRHIFTEETLPTLLVPEREYTFDNKIKLLGYRVVDGEGNDVVAAASGDVVFYETYYEVLERVNANRKMFIHVDFGSQRINGDHDICDGEFPMNYWVPGEIVRDRYELTIDRGSAAGDYVIMMGFFSGDSRMETRPATGDNRIQVGSFRITGGL